MRSVSPLSSPFQSPIFAPNNEPFNRDVQANVEFLQITTSSPSICPPLDPLDPTDRAILGHDGPLFLEMPPASPEMVPVSLSVDLVHELLLTNLKSPLSVNESPIDRLKVLSTTMDSIMSSAADQVDWQIALERLSVVWTLRREVMQDLLPQVPEDMQSDPIIDTLVGQMSTCMKWMVSIHFNLGNYEKAFAFGQFWAQLKQPDLQGWSQLADYYTQMNRLGSAANCCHNMMTLQSSDYTSTLTVARLLRGIAQRHTDLPDALTTVYSAIRYLTMAIEVQPNSPEAYFERALAYGVYGRRDSMVADLERVRSMPGFIQQADLHFYLALGYSAQGRVEDGLFQFGLALQIGSERQREFYRQHARLIEQPTNSTFSYDRFPFNRD